MKINGHPLIDSTQLDLFVKMIGNRRLFVQALPSAAWTIIVSDTDSIAMAINQLGTEDAKGVYYGINPMKLGTRTAPQNDAIERRRFLYIDVDDPDHDAKIPATAEGKAQAHAVNQQIIAVLRKFGWSAPVQLDSGNGFAQYYRVDLPNDDPTARLFADLLAALRTKFGPLVDTTVHDARRISRVPGTINRRGPESPERPHRPCLLLDVPDQNELVTADMIRAAVTELRAESAKSQHTHEFATSHSDDVATALAALAALNPSRADEYKSWCEVGMILQSVDQSLLAEWDQWSMSSAKYRDGVCMSKWRSFTPGGGLGLGTLIRWAREDSPGFQPRQTGKGGAVQLPPAASGPSANSETVVDVIKQHLVTKYLPTFRRGGDVYSGVFGRVITRNEACSAPTSSLVELLMAARDYPRGQDGPIRARFPTTYRQWAPVAWADLLETLPDETDSAELAETAAEQFRSVVADALMTIESFSYKHRSGDLEKMEIQRRSLIDWCRLFAKPGPWQSVRSLALWVRLNEENQLEVAMHQHLFGQIRRGNHAPSTHRQFVQLAELYGIGAAGRTSRARFVELTREFLADLMSTPCDGRCDGECDAAPTYAGGDSASRSSSHAPSHAGAVRDDVTEEPHLEPTTEGRGRLAIGRQP
jgi:Primase C terminal 2 (PriCT-2)